MPVGSGAPREDGARAPGPGLAWLGPDAARVRVLARVWATVELERALGDLGLDPASATAAVADPHLGARVVIVPPGPADGPDAISIALAEPATEGRLAAWLARHDEGPAGWYVRAPVGLDDLRAAAAVADITLSRTLLGPFGPSVLAVAGLATGEPALILADPAAVPSRP